MSTATTTPAGYWENAKGALVPISKIKSIDKDRHNTVVAICEEAKKQQGALIGFKLTSNQAVQDFVTRSAQEYGVQPRGAKGKGNITLTSYDGRYKVVRQIQDTLVFDERLQHAKVLIDECVKDWGKGGKPEAKVLLNDAFQVDKAGCINVDRVLGLRRLGFTDERWLRAMKAIDDSIQVASSKSYTRFYERDASGKYLAISLDVAAV